MNREERERLRGRLVKAVKPPTYLSLHFPDAIAVGQWWQYGLWSADNPEPMSPERIIDIRDPLAIHTQPIAGNVRFMEFRDGCPVPNNRWHYLGNGEQPAQ